MTSHMNILFIDTVHSCLQQGLERDGHQCTNGTTWSRHEILDRIGDFHGVVLRSRVTIDQELLDKAVSLRFIARSGAGMENIDVAYALHRKVRCFNSPEGNRDAVGEHALGMLLSLMNNLFRADREVRNGIWNRESNRGTEISGKTVGLIGYGHMGSSFARRLVGFDCDVLAFDKYRKNYADPYAYEATMQQIFSKADIVSLHVPLTEETTYLADAAFFNSFEKPVWFINTARGKCTRLTDLVNAIKAGKVLGACLDVLEYEDTSFEKFDLANSDISRSDEWRFLISSDRVILSPHIAGWSVESYIKLSSVLLDKIRAAFPSS